MGFAYVTSPCKLCRRLVSYHPHKVPSMRDKVSGDREPVCPDCVERLNVRLRALGQSEISVIDGAYEPFDECAL